MRIRWDGKWVHLAYFIASLPSFCQKLSKLVENWWSSDKNNFAQFFETRCMSFCLLLYHFCFTEKSVTCWIIILESYLTRSLRMTRYLIRENSTPRCGWRVISSSYVGQPDPDEWRSSGHSLPSSRLGNAYAMHLQRMWLTEIGVRLP